MALLVREWRGDTPNDYGVVWVDIQFLEGEVERIRPDKWKEPFYVRDGDSQAKGYLKVEDKDIHHVYGGRMVKPAHVVVRDDGSVQLISIDVGDTSYPVYAS